MPLTVDNISTCIAPSDCAPGEVCALVPLGDEELADLDIVITDADILDDVVVSGAAALPVSSSSSSSCPVALSLSGGCGTGVHSLRRQAAVDAQAGLSHSAVRKRHEIPSVVPWRCAVQVKVLQLES